MHASRAVLVTLLAVLAALGRPAFGQEVDVGGRAYVDYFYNVETPEGDDEGLHGFEYRRLYLTTDFTLSEALSGRARLEAPEGATGVSGVKVKDLSLTWNYAGDHAAHVGVTPPPAFGLAEDVWGYRSLDKTILDLQGIVSSRDFGLRVDGPVTSTGMIRYAAMISNNTGTGFVETDRYKRIYGQIELRPTDRFLFVAGGDYAGYNDERDGATRLSAFGGYSTDRFRVGLEGYWYKVAMTNGSSALDIGGSLYGIVRVTSSWELVARIDRSREPVAGGWDTQFDTFVVGGVAYRPHSNVAFIPNLRVRDLSTAGAETTARVTLEVDF